VATSSLAHVIAWIGIECDSVPFELINFFLLNYVSGMTLHVVLNFLYYFIVYYCDMSGKEVKHCMVISPCEAMTVFLPLSS